jgi:hypothetical protein
MTWPLKLGFAFLAFTLSLAAAFAFIVVDAWLRQ